MARLRKFAAYRRLERPYTRKSKYKSKSFIRAKPNSKIVRYKMGDQKKEYDYVLYLTSRENLQIRDNAMESARLATNRFMEKKAGKLQYYIRLRPFPHHVLRENALASGAGADRLSTGMKMSFGKPVGIAAQIREGQILIEVHVLKNHVKFARKALKRAASKLPMGCIVEEQSLKK